MANKKVFGLLENEIPSTFKDDRSEDVVMQAVKVISESYDVTTEKRSALDAIQKMIDDVADVSEPQGNELLPAYIGYQTIMSLVGKMRPLDVIIKSGTASEDVREIVSEGVGYIMKQGGYLNVLRDGYSGFIKQMTYGDFFAMIGTKDNGLPAFKDVKISQLHFNSGANTLRNGTQRANKAVVIFEYDWDEAIKLFPKLNEIGTAGRIPANLSKLNQKIESWREEYRKQIAESRIVEIAYYYDINDEPRMTIFAGEGATILEDYKGKDYPFFLDKDGNQESYIPLLQWTCFPINNSIYNIGFMHLIYKIAMIYKQLTNKSIQYMMANVNPLKIINLPVQQVSGFLAKVKAASQLQAQGKPGLIINDYGNGDKQGGAGVMDTLQSPPISNEMQVIEEMLVKLLRWFGVNLDRVYTDPQKTATAVSIEEENTLETIQNIQEGNTQTWEDAVRFSMDFIVKNVSPHDETIIPIKKIESINEEIEKINGKSTTMQLKKIEGLTLGQLQQLLANHKWDIVVNSRTGVVFSKILERTYTNSAIQDLMAIGDMEGAKKLIAKKHGMNGINIKLSEPQPQQGGASAPQEPIEPPKGVAIGQEEVLNLG